MSFMKPSISMHLLKGGIHYRSTGAEVVAALCHI